MNVLLVRHGQTEYSVTNRFLGRRDVALDSVGVRQAISNRDAIKQFAPGLAISSPLLRARQTLALMAPPGLVQSVDERLVEVDFGAWEGQVRATIEQQDPDGIRAFDRGEMVEFPGGESLGNIALRVSAAVRNAIGRTDRLLVVGHTTSLRLGLTHLLGLEPRCYRQIFATIEPCRFVEIEVEPPGSCHLIGFNVDSSIRERTR